MPNGFGRGGWGFGFRGSSPPWPYVGIGRGGLPRCGYFLGGAAGVPPMVGHHFPGEAPYAPQATREQELDFLRSQAEAMRGHLEQIDARIKELEQE